MDQVGGGGGIMAEWAVSQFEIRTGHFPDTDQKHPSGNFRLYTHTHKH